MRVTCIMTSQVSIFQILNKNVFFFQIPNGFNIRLPLIPSTVVIRGFDRFCGRYLNADFTRMNDISICSKWWFQRSLRGKGKIFSVYELDRLYFWFCLEMALKYFKCLYSSSKLIKSIFLHVNQFLTPLSFIKLFRFIYCCHKIIDLHPNIGFWVNWTLKLSTNYLFLHEFKQMLKFLHPPPSPLPFIITLGFGDVNDEVFVDSSSSIRGRSKNT